MKASRKNSAVHRCILETLESRRLMAAGALDPSFGAGGKFSLRFGLDQSAPHTLVAQDVAIQPDGKTVIAAKFDDPKQFGDAASDFALVRLNFNGTLDTTFGTADHPGIAIVHVGKAGARVVVSSLTIQPNGRIIVAGGAIRERSFHEDPLEMAVARFLPNGKLDKTFDGDGARFIEFDGSVAEDIALQKDGKIVLVGSHFEGSFSGFDNDFAVARLNTDGSMDKTFSGDGKSTFGSDDSDSANGVAIDAAGRIVVVGSSGPFNKQRIVLTRLNRDGSRDTTFGSNGTVETNIARFAGASAQDVLIQASGKIVVLAEADIDPRSGFTNNQFALLRYDRNGALDASFGNSAQGFVETGFGGDDIPQEIVQAAGGGLFAAGTTNGKFALSSYTADGVLNSSFGTAGKVITDFGADGTAGSVGVAYGPGRRIVIAGGDVLKIARYLDLGANQVTLASVAGSPNLGAAETGPGALTDTATFRVARAEVLPFATRVFFNISGTAINNVDYTTNLKRVLQLPPIFDIGSGQFIPAPPSPGQAFIDIPAGTDSVIVTLSPTDDGTFEALETAKFSIVPNAAYELTSSQSVTTEIADNDSIFVNFQAPGPAPSSPRQYVADVGDAFGNRGNGLTYGWDADNTANARTRNNPLSPDARFDSLVKMQDGVNRKWEIALPNGMYSVQLDAGDPDFTDSVYKLSLENNLALEGTPGGDVHWFERSFNVLVTDGRLTLSNAAGSVNNKIAFMHITPAAPGAVAGPTTGTIPGRLLSAPRTAAFAPRVFSNRLIEQINP
jgi:uncharacterized delta-60 repeat protein